METTSRASTVADFNTTKNLERLISILKDKNILNSIWGDI